MPETKTAAALLQVTDQPLDQVKPYWNNPRNNSNAVQRVADSLQEFGWRQPIVVDTEGIIIVGHTRYAAAKQLGYSQVPVHVAADLSPAKTRAYRIADNRTGEFSEWDADKLLEELMEIENDYSAESLGFDLEDIDPQDLSTKDWDFSETKDEYIITITGSLDMQAEVRNRLRDMDGVKIEASYIKKS